MLSNEVSRKIYDEERWLSGRFGRRQQNISPGFLVSEVRKLASHLTSVDVYRMNKELLRDYLLFLLREQHLGVMQKHASSDEWLLFIKGILEASRLLPLYFERDIVQVLIQLVPNISITGVQEIITEEYHRLQKKGKINFLLPWLIALTTLLACVAMYLYASRF